MTDYQNELAALSAREQADRIASVSSGGASVTFRGPKELAEARKAEADADMAEAVARRANYDPTKNFFVSKWGSVR